MATRAGYLWKRMAGGNPGGGQPAGPGGVQRVYCVLTGTTLWDYDTEEEAALGLRPRCEVEIIGASPWDGKASRYQSYAFGFLFLSALGTTYHAVAQSKEDLEGWLAALRVGLQAKFGIVGAGASSLPDLDDEEDGEEEEEEDGEEEPSQQPSQRRPLSKRRSARRALVTYDRAGSSSSCSSSSGGKCSKAAEDGGASGRGAAPAACGGVLGSTVPPTFHPPARRDAEVCGISGQPLGRGNAKTFCLSCGGAFGQDNCCEDVPLPHYRCQQGVRVCRNCFLAQAFLNHLKLLNAALRTHLHELEASAAPVADKGSAKIRVFRQPSKEAFLAWQLYEGSQIDASEFTELLRADARLRDERENTRLAEFQAGLDRLVGAGDAMALLRLLFDLRDAAEPVQYASILHRLRALAEANLSAVDFILPQLLQVFVLLPADPSRGLAQALQLEALEDFIVQLCALSCHQQQQQQQAVAGPVASPAGPALVPARSEQVAIPLRVVWAMMGYYEDTLQLHAPAQLIGKRGRIIRLTLRVEAAVRGRPHELNPEILAIFTIPSPAQLALIQREWALLHDCRGHPLLAPFPPKTAFRRMHGEIGDDPAVVAQQLAEAIARYRRESRAGGATSPLAVTAAEAGDAAGGISFARQMKFVKELTDAAEALRHIDPSLRRETLRATLARLQGSPEYKGVCFPLTRDYGPMPRILRICVEEGAVFRSKARVPVLICFEVLRPPIAPSASLSAAAAATTATAAPLALPPSPSPPPAPAPVPPPTEPSHPQQHGPYLSEEEADHLLDSLPGSKAAFHERMSSLEEEATAAAAAVAAGTGLRKGSGPSPVASTAEAAAMGATGPLTPTRRRTLSKDGVGGGSGSNLNSPSVDRYASKSEVLKLVLTRRRKQGGGAVATPTSTGSTSSSASSSSATADGGEIDLQQLIRQYEASCSMAAPADEEAEGAGEGGVGAGAGPGAAAGAGRRPSSSLLGGLSPAVATALAEFKKGNLSEAELRQLVSNDLKFRQNLQETSYLDVQFFVSMAFGESWAAKRARIQAASPDGQRPGWDLLSMIVKSNDDLRQEVCTVQLIELCRDVFGEAGLELWLEPYGIISTTSSTGLIETLTDALSLDALKKKEGYVSLAHHFEASYGHDRARLAHAKRAFITSLAAYSLVCYVLQIKDRHNGNILLDTAGHLIHIDYGFILGIAPGGSFSIETAPFKLTAEMVDVMGGVDSPLFDEFTTLFACGFHALQVNIERIVVLIEIMAESSRYPCFHNADKNVIIQRLRQRLCPGRSKADTVAFALDLIMQSYNSITTRQYDNYQYLSQNIMP